MSTRRRRTHRSRPVHRAPAPVLLMLTLNLTPFAGAPVAGTDCTVTKPRSGATEASLGFSVPERLPAGALEGALAIWERCREMGFDIPELGPAAPGRQNLVVHYERNSESFGRCGMIQGSVITIYRFAWDEHGTALDCGPPAVNLAHEIGHFLGLRDAYPTWECWPNLMAGVSTRRGGHRTVNREICAAVSGLWKEALEPSRRKEAPLVASDDSRAGHNE